MKFMAEQLIFDKEKDSLVRFYGPFQMPNWDGVEDAEFEHVVEGTSERLEKIAATYYDNRYELWWVIAARNNMDLPDVNLYQGRRLKIPHPEWVDTVLLKQAPFIDKD